MEDAVAAVAAGLDIDYVALFELKSSEELVAVAASGSLATVLGTDGVATATESQIRYTMATGAAVVADDVANDTRFASPSILVDLGVVSALSVIVRVSGRFHGVLAVYSSLSGRFAAEDVNFVQAVANVMAAAIERRRHEEAQEQLHRQDRLAAVGQLAAGVAHDFNNIVAAIRLYVELLETEPGFSDAAHGYVGVIRQQVERGASLVWQVLDFAHHSSLELIDVDLARWLEQLRPLLGRTLPFPVTLTVAHDGLPYWVRADTTRLQQILMNLVSNANHAIEGPGHITISLFRHGVDGDHTSPLDNPLRRPSVRVDVDDTGTGMDATVLARAFDPFFTTKSPGEGTGLGLAQVQGLIAQHEGHIDVSSTPGVGTTVSFWLPSAETAGLSPTATSTPTATQPPDIPRGRGQAMLVVDDDPAVRAAMAGVINWLGYTATVAESGETACSILNEKSGSIAAVVSDVMMPGMGGETLAQVIADNWPEIPVILVSGNPNPIPFEPPTGATRSEEPQRPPFVRLHKPFTSRDLAGAINAALHRSSGLDRRAPTEGAPRQASVDARGDGPISRWRGDEELFL
jgi:signal transduction histidine kinase